MTDEPNELLLSNLESDEMKPFSPDRALVIISEKSRAELDPTLCVVFSDLAEVLPETPYLPESLQGSTSSTS
jgi:hypothetical protein